MRDLYSAGQVHATNNFIKGIWVYFLDIHQHKLKEKTDEYFVEFWYSRWN